MARCASGTEGVVANAFLRVRSGMVSLTEDLGSAGRNRCHIPMTVAVGAIKIESNGPPDSRPWNYRGTMFGSVVAPPRPVTLPYNPMGILDGVPVYHVNENIVIAWKKWLPP